MNAAQVSSTQLGSAQLVEYTAEQAHTSGTHELTACTWQPAQGKGEQTPATCDTVYTISIAIWCQQVRLVGDATLGYPATSSHDWKILIGFVASACL